MDANNMHVTDDQTPGIFRHASAKHVNYWKWAVPLIDSRDPSLSVPCFLPDATFGDLSLLGTEALLPCCTNLSPL
jgi:hypothetical protein